MKALPKHAIALMLAATAGPAFAQPESAERPCVNRHEMRTLVAFALPLAIEGVSQKCTPRLGPDAYLSRSGTRLANRYRREAPADWADARPIFERISGKNLGPADPLNQSFERQLAEHMIADMVANAVHPRDCDKIDLAIELAAPLHADDIATVSSLLVSVVERAEEDRDGERKLPFNICRMRD
jgi:hypothetical protein